MNFTKEEVEIIESSCIRAGENLKDIIFENEKSIEEIEKGFNRSLSTHWYENNIAVCRRKLGNNNFILNKIKEESK